MKSLAVITNVCNAESFLCKFFNEYWERHQPCSGHVHFSSSIKNRIPGVSTSTSPDINYERDGARTDSMISMLVTYTVNTCVIVA